jgi:hypothetical protein
MTASPEAAAPLPDDLEAAMAWSAAGGDAREAVKALIVANNFLDQQLDELRTKVSAFYARGRLPPARDRKE